MLPNQTNIRIHNHPDDINDDLYDLYCGDYLTEVDTNYTELNSAIGSIMTGFYEDIVKENSFTAEQYNQCYMLFESYFGYRLDKTLLENQIASNSVLTFSYDTLLSFFEDIHVLFEPHILSYNDMHKQLFYIHVYGVMLNNVNNTVLQMPTKSFHKTVYIPCLIFLLTREFTKARSFIFQSLYTAKEWVQFYHGGLADILKPSYVILDNIWVNLFLTEVLPDLNPLCYPNPTAIFQSQINNWLYFFCLNRSNEIPQKYLKFSNYVPIYDKMLTREQIYNEALQLLHIESISNMLPFNNHEQLYYDFLQEFSNGLFGDVSLLKCYVNYDRFCSQFPKLSRYINTVSCSSGYVSLDGDVLYQQTLQKILHLSRYYIKNYVNIYRVMDHFITYFKSVLSTAKQVDMVTLEEYDIHDVGLMNEFVKLFQYIVSRGNRG
jgi:hypothetical protein